MKTSVVWLLAFGLLTWAAGCAKTGGPALKPGETRILQGKTGEIVHIDAVMDDLERADVIYVGETHDDIFHHEVQLTILRAMDARHENFALGMEMFQAQFQDVLDRYLSEEIGEVAMLRETQWRTRWGFDWDLYAPMVRYARDNDIPVIALNAPSELTRAVARNGLDGLSNEQRKQLPEMDLDNEDHRALIEKMLAGAHHAHGRDSFESLYAAQVLWDESMAQNTAEYLKSSEQPMLVLAGIGHVAGGLGIPSRVQRRMGGTAKTVIPTTRNRSVWHIRDHNADWLWMVPRTR